MSNTGWSPKPRRDFNLNGLFSYDDGEATVKIEKANRWQQQRERDGTPYVRSGATALSPPPAGPKLTLNGLNKAVAADFNPNKVENEDDELEKGIDPEAVVKSYFEVCEALIKGDAEGAISLAQGVTQKQVRGAPKEKSLDCDDDEDKLEKTK